MKILGIDPGFASIGWALVDLDVSMSYSVESLGVFRTEKANKKQNVLAANDNYRRTREISKALRALVVETLSDGTERRKVHAICAESMSFPRNASSAAKMALCWGVMADICEDVGVALLMATPKQVKKAVTGSGSASKELVQAAVDEKFFGRPREILLEKKVPNSQQEHPYDALAAVLACMDSEQIRLLLQFTSEHAA